MDYKKGADWIKPLTNWREEAVVEGLPAGGKGVWLEKRVEKRRRKESKAWKAH